jgi:nucleotide-binding universal stress UspA family protein
MALDASTSGLAAMKTAVALASRMEAELLGLFVEDVNLLRLAALPFAREVSFFPATTRRLDSAGMERALRAQASWAEAALLEAADRQRVRCSFRVVRGEVTTQLLAAVRDIDLVALGMMRPPFHPRGSNIRTIVNATQSSVLLLSPDARINMPVVVVYDGSPDSVKAMSAARSLSRRQGSTLTVLTAGKAETRKAEIMELPEGSGLTVRYRSLPDMNIVDVARCARQEAAGTLVLSANLCQEEKTLEELLGHVDCTVLLVR